MKPGDYVIKTEGRNSGTHALVLNVCANAAGNTIIEVLVEKELTFWPVQYVKLFKQEKKMADIRTEPTMENWNRLAGIN